MHTAKGNEGKEGGSLARWIHPRGTLCHAGCLLATPLAETNTLPSHRLLTQHRNLYAVGWQRRKRKERKKRQDISTFPTSLLTPLSFFIPSVFPYFLLTLRFTNSIFHSCSPTKEMYITVSNFRCDLYFFSFYDIPSCHVFSQLFSCYDSSVFHPRYSTTFPKSLLKLFIFHDI